MRVTCDACLGMGEYSRPKHYRCIARHAGQTCACTICARDLELTPFTPRPRPPAPSSWAKLSDSQRQRQNAYRSMRPERVAARNRAQEKADRRTQDIEKAVAMLAEGETWQDIADELGWRKNTLQVAVGRHQGRYAA